jgi:hypothetical protein
VTQDGNREFPCPDDMTQPSVRDQIVRLLIEHEQLQISEACAARGLTTTPPDLYQLCLKLLQEAQPSEPKKRGRPPGTVNYGSPHCQCALKAIEFVKPLNYGRTPKEAHDHNVKQFKKWLKELGGI